MRTPQIGQTYRHFKGKDYIIIDIVNDANSQNEDELDQIVIYQALYGEKLKWARPLSEFLSLADHKKHPNITQKYRFEKITKEKL